MFRSLMASVLLVPLLCLQLTACNGRSENQRAQLDLVILANKDEPTAFELYAAASDGSGTLKLSPALQDPGNDVLDFAVSPSRRYVAFREGFSGGTRLYIASLETFSAFEVSGFLGNLPQVLDYAWSSSGDYLGFRGRNSGEFAVNLYTVRASDRLTERINLIDNARPTAITVTRFQWSPDGQSIAYVADEDITGQYELYATSPDSNGKRQLSGLLVTGGDVSDIAWSPDSNRIAYLASQDDVSVHELYASFSDGSGNIKVSGGVTGSGVNADTFEWRPDSTGLQYRITDTTVNTGQIYLGFADGTANVRISTNIPDGSYAQWAQWSPDGQYILFIGDVGNDGIRELYTATPDGINLVELTPPGNNLNPDIASLSWSPDGSRVAFASAPATSFLYDLYTATPDGTSNTRVTDFSSLNATLVDVAWAPAGSQLAYRSLDMNANTLSLFLTSADGAVVTPVADSLSTVALLIHPEWIQQGALLAFVADLDTLNLGELFVRDDNAVITPVSGGFSTVLVSGTGVTRFAEF